MIRRHRRWRTRRALFTGLAVVATIWAMPACSTAEIAKEGIQDTGEARSAACAADEQTMAVSAEAFAAMEGRYPATMDEVVAAGLIRQAPTALAYSANADGSVYSITTVAGGPCEQYAVTVGA